MADYARDGRNPASNPLYFIRPRCFQVFLSALERSAGRVRTGASAVPRGFEVLKLILRPKSDEKRTTTERGHVWYLKRVARITIGWSFIVAGISWLFLLLLQGVLFLMIGLLILSKEYRRAEGSSHAYAAGSLRRMPS